MGRRARKNWNNLEISKKIAKQLVLHRLWNELPQRELAKDINASFQQYQKLEKCISRIFAEQLVSICNNRKWDSSVILQGNPEDTIREWIKEFNVDALPHKYYKIINQWEMIDKSAENNYFRGREIE